MHDDRSGVTSIYTQNKDYINQNRDKYSSIALEVINTSKSETFKYYTIISFKNILVINKIQALKYSGKNLDEWTVNIKHLPEDTK